MKTSVGLILGCVVLAGGMVLAEDFPFVPSANKIGGTAADMSYLVPAPAGRDGFVRTTKDGHFATDAGRWLINGVNLTGAANFPSHEQASRLAVRLARLGVNCVRLHYMDADYGNFMQKPERGICESNGVLRVDRLERLDFLVAEFKKHGVYVDLNLQVARYLKRKGPTMFDAAMIASQKDYAKSIFTHVNPYTGIAWKDDPVVAIVELSNEDGVTALFAKDAKTKRPEFVRHTIKLEREYLAEMRRYLRELGVKAPVTATCVPFVPPHSQMSGDYIDYHDYWCHPGPVNEQWREMDEPVIAWTGTDWCSMALATGRRVWGMPFTVSEYGHPYPSTYGAEGQPLMRAVSAHQDWDGIFTYSWANREDIEPVGVEYFFSISQRPDVIAHMPAMAAIALRGDVARYREKIAVPLTEDSYVNDYYDRNPSWCKSADVQIATGAKVRFEQGLVHGLGLDLTGQAKVPAEPLARTGKRIVSDTNEIVWDRTVEGGAYATVNGRNVKFFTGFAKGRSFDIGETRLAIGATRKGWATISVLSRDASGFGDKGAARLLVAATGFCRNAGAKETVGEKDKDGMMYLATRGADWGKGPVVCEDVPFTLELPVDAGRVTCQALDGEGVAMGSVKPVSCGEKRAKLAFGGQRTVWYDVTIR